MAVLRGLLLGEAEEKDERAGAEGQGTRKKCFEVNINEELVIVRRFFLKRQQRCTINLRV